MDNQFIASNEFLKTYEWRKARQQVLDKYDSRCMCCGTKPTEDKYLCVDHIKPRKTNPELALDVDNLQILCNECNHGKGNWSIKDYRGNGTFIITEPVTFNITEMNLAHGEMVSENGKPIIFCAKTTKKDREEGNNHNTVKPTELMKYLCRLITPKDGIVLDPFMGSGSTGKAAMLEDRKFIGCEMDEGYFEIAKNRILNAIVNKGEEHEDTRSTLRLYRKLRS